MLKVDQLSKQIAGGPVVLSDVCFEASPGQFIAIRGESGSGKSSLLKCLALQDSFTAGNYYIHDKSMYSVGFLDKIKHRRQLAYLEEKPMLYVNRTALRNVIIGSINQTPFWRRWSGVLRNDQYMNAMDIIEKFGLLDRAHQKAGTLSGGEKQRIAIARAIAHGAQVLFIDEPVSGLDHQSADIVLRDLQRLCRQQQLLVVAVLSQGDWAERYADRILTLSDGKLISDRPSRKYKLEHSAPSQAQPDEQKVIPTILVVDDQKPIRSLLMDTLSSDQYLTLEAGNAKETIEILVKQRVNVIVLDLTLPDLSGDQLLTEVRKNAPDASLIVITGQPFVHVKQLMERYAIQHVVQKPFDLLELQQLVHTQLPAQSVVLNGEIV